MASTSNVPVPPPDDPGAAVSTGRSCYICLQTEAENPDAKWVSACPCSLETHESCMLHWIAEEEVRSGGSSTARGKNIRCPACRAQIRVEEPFDALVYMRQRLHFAYSKVTPFVLLWVVSSSTMVGSGYYGFVMGQVFAGPQAMMRWLRVESLTQNTLHRRRPLPLGLLTEFGVKFVGLSMVGPLIVFGRVFPVLMRNLLLPVSFVDMGYLIFTNQPVTWPPSPEWAVTMMPFVHLVYSHMYYEWFGGLEKRLNRALRGQPPVEEADEQQPVRNAHRPIIANNRNPRRVAEDEELGLWALLTAIWNAVFHEGHGLQADGQGNVPVGELELEVRLEVAPAGVEDENEDEADVELVEAMQDVLDGVPGLEQAVREEAARAEEVQEQPDLPMPGAAGGEPLGEQERAQAGDGAADDNNQAPPANENNNNNNDNNAAEAQNPADDIRPRNTTGIVSEIINSLVTSLMFPVISAGIGEILRVAAPKSWVTPRRMNGAPATLMQQRWGRSLLGGCLFVVMKDAWVLYLKYRRVQQKLHRKVKNVEKRARTP